MMSRTDTFNNMSSQIEQLSSRLV